MSLYLSRLRLARSPSVAALSALLQPEDDGARQDAHHRLLWSVFAGDPGARRDFLWRDEGRGTFLTLSSRTPGASPLFDPPEIKEFKPDLAPGDRLAFSLRANSTQTVKTGRRTASGAEHKQHRDVVMHALYPLKEDRAEARMQAAQVAGESWMAGQGTRAGFTLDQMTVGAYTVAVLPGHVGKRRGQPQYGILDMAGVLTVSDPATFLGRLGQGFGRAKAFGCGLMLIRRA